MQGPMRAMTEHGRFQGSELWQVDYYGSLSIYTWFDVQLLCFWKTDEKHFSSISLRITDTSRN